jgi:Stress responsive A/B Barrel Domain
VALELDGCLAVRVGVDAGLREGNFSFAITNDFVDADAYRRYDADAEHNRVRAEMFAPINETVVRIQFETD